MANRREGPDRGVSGRPGSLPWREDPVILGRMRDGQRWRASGLSAPEIAQKLDVHVSVVYEDRNRLIELVKEEAANAVEQHILNLRQQANEIKDALEGTDRRSLNVGQLRGLLRQIEMDIAKLDGSLIERRETKVDADGLTFTLNLTGP